ncbi:MAG: FAD-dependent monooxygenase [Alphaproteobacteria bacterium]
MKVLISGGGIGGLTTALACLHYGHDVQIFEQATAMGAVGAGIQIPPNAMKIFQALGVEDKIRANAFQPEAIETRMGESGITLFTIPLARQAITRWGAPYLHIHRADYIAALAECLTAAAPSALMMEAQAESYTQDDNSITLHLDDGRHFSGDVLIAADGIHSRLRHQMLGKDEARFTGNVAWRAVVPIDQLGAFAPNPTACAWMGAGRHAVTYRLRRGKLANFVGVVEREDWTKESWNEPGAPADALQDFAQWHPTITRLLEAVNPDALFRWALFDRKPLPQWTHGRAALLGDAAHPMLPFMAQGAAMAVEDAWAIAAELSKPDANITDALASYQRRRHARTVMLQNASRANAKTFHQRTTFGRLKTYGPMWLGGRFLPNLVHGRMDPIYGHDETSL